jgi:hypothetical protein
MSNLILEMNLRRKEDHLVEMKLIIIKSFSKASKELSLSEI